MLKLKEKHVDNIVESIVNLLKNEHVRKSYTFDELEKLWYDYIKRVDPQEQKFKVTIERLLKRNYQEILDNIKKYPENYTNWTFRHDYWLGQYTEAETMFITKIYKQEGQIALDYAIERAGKSYKVIDYAFDVFNELVINALLAQTSRFSPNLVNTTENIIRMIIAIGLREGESIETLAERVQVKLGSDNINYRAQMIARSETIYASNAGAELGYLQSGVVEGKEWIAAMDNRTCDICSNMDGMKAYIGTSGWSKEGMNLEDVRSQFNLNFDYTNGEMPHAPIHPRCRCSIVPIFEMVTGE